MMKKTKIIRGGIMALFVLAALLLVYLVVRQTMPDIIPLLRSGDEEALEAYLSRDMSFTGILYMALLQMVQVWSIVISGVIVNVAAGVVVAKFGTAVATRTEIVEALKNQGV